MTDVLYATCDSSTPTPSPAIIHGTQKAKSEDLTSQVYFDERLSQAFITSSIEGIAAHVIDDLLGTPNHSFHNLYSDMSESSEDKYELKIQTSESSALIASPLREAEDLQHQENSTDPSYTTTHLKRGAAIRTTEAHPINDDLVSNDAPLPPLQTTQHFLGPATVAMSDGVHVSRHLDGSKIVIGKCEPDHPLHQALPSWARGQSSGGRRELISNLSNDICPDPWQETLDKGLKPTITITDTFRRRVEPWDLARVDVLESLHEDDEPRYSLKWTGPKPSLFLPGQVDEQIPNLMRLDDRPYIRPIHQPIQPNDFKTTKVIEVVKEFLNRECRSEPSIQEEIVDIDEGQIPAHTPLPQRFLRDTARSDFIQPTHNNDLSSINAERAIRRPTRNPASLPFQPLLGPTLDELAKNVNADAVFWHGNRTKGVPLLWELGEFFTAPPSKRDIALALKRISTSPFTEEVHDNAIAFIESVPTTVLPPPVLEEGAVTNPTEPQAEQISDKPVLHIPKPISAIQAALASIPVAETTTSNVVQLKFQPKSPAPQPKKGNALHNRRREKPDYDKEPLLNVQVKQKINMLDVSQLPKLPSSLQKLSTSAPGLPPPPPSPPPPPPFALPLHIYVPTEDFKNSSEATIVEEEEEDVIEDGDDFSEAVHIPKQSSEILVSIQRSPSPLMVSPAHDRDVTFVDSDQHKLNLPVLEVFGSNQSETDSEPYKSPPAVSIQESAHFQDSGATRQELSISISGGEEADDIKERPNVKRKRSSVSIDEDQVDDCDSNLGTNLTSQPSSEPRKRVTPKKRNPTALPLISIPRQTRSSTKGDINSPPPLSVKSPIMDVISDAPVDRLKNRRASSKSPVIAQLKDKSEPGNSMKRLKRSADADKDIDLEESDKNIVSASKEVPKIWRTKTVAAAAADDDDVFEFK